jgi:transcriptional regulator with XRE-family HTH domain
MEGMNMLAVGAYLRALRSHQGLSQGKLAELVGVAGNTIWRIEAGEQEPRAGQLAALLTALHGRIEDIQRLITDSAATAADGEELAGRILTLAERDSILALADTDEKRARLLRRIAQLTENPELRARIEGYLDGLESPPSQ